MSDSGQTRLKREAGTGCGRFSPEPPTRKDGGGENRSILDNGRGVVSARNRGRLVHLAIQRAEETLAHVGREDRPLPPSPFCGKGIWLCIHSR